jgi:hypothetical protein
MAAICSEGPEPVEATERLKSLADKWVIAAKRIHKVNKKVGSPRLVYQLDTRKRQVSNLNLIAHSSMKEIEPDHFYLFETQTIRYQIAKVTQLQLPQQFIASQAFTNPLILGFEQYASRLNVIDHFRLLHKEISQGL